MSTQVVTPQEATPVSPDSPPQQPKTFQYQVTDDAGKPLGRPTVIHYNTDAELVEKIKAAHIEASRALWRRPDPKVEPVAPRLLTADEAKSAVDAIVSQNPDEAKSAIRRIVESEFGLTPETVKTLSEQREAAARNGETYRFLSGHLYEYNNCDANATILRDYLDRNNMAWTANNLEIAFSAERDRLIPVERPAPSPTVVPAEPANPVPPRRAPTGIAPGSTSGATRTTTGGFTKADALKMAKEKTSDQLRAWLNQPGNREKFETALNSR